MVRYALLGLWALLLVACSSKKSPGKSEDPATDSVPYAGNPPVLINEMVSVNLNYKDHRGSDPGWVEFYNPSSSPVDLAGYALTEERSNMRQWVMGHVIVPPGGYSLVFLSELNLSEPGLPADTVHLMSSFAYSWADSQNTPPGRSVVLPNLFPGEVSGMVDGKAQISATLVVGDNRGTGIGWTAAKVFMGFKGFDETDTVDLSGKNRLLLTAYLQQGKKLGLRLAQQGLEDWNGWITWIEGTGDSNEVYVVTLPQSGVPMLSALWGITFEAQQLNIDTVSFIVRDLRAVSDPQLAHGNFKLNEQGGFLWLTDSEGMVRDSVSYPPLEGEVAWAKDLAGNWGFQRPPTPMHENGSTSLQYRAPEVEVMLEGGFYPNPIQVALTVPQGANVHYTTDGSVPTSNSAIYSGPIAVDTTTVIRSIAVQPGALNSPVTTRTYFIADSATLPVVSIAVDPNSMFDPDTGLHVEGPNKGTAQPYYGANYWWEKELSVHVEFFEPGGGRGFEIGAGLSIFGNWSRMNPKKSLALFFREDYGASSLKYTLYPDYPNVREFESFILRGGASNTGRDQIRDPLAQTLSIGLNVDYQKYRPSVVYINGRYWGIMDIREKLNAGFIKSNYGYNKDMINLLTANGVDRGTAVTWNEFLDWIATADMNASATRARVLNTIDMDNYMNYMATEIFVNNTDWPANNIKFWNCLSPETKWRWIFYDLDFGFGSNAGTGATAGPSFNSYPFVTNASGPDWPNSPRSTLLFRRLMQDTLFRADWINRLATLLSWQFSPERVGSRIDVMINQLGSHYQREIERWDYRQSQFDAELEIIRNFGAARAGYLRQHTRTFFTLGADAPATLIAENGGQIQVNGLTLPLSSFSGVWYAGHPLRLTAVEPTGKTFMGWSDGVTTLERFWDPALGGSLSARFR